MRKLSGTEERDRSRRGTSTTAILLHQTRTVPIIFANVADPVGSGFVASLSRPGGNLTGFTAMEGSVAGKWLELLKEIAPRVARVVRHMPNIS